jgi:hypothetical protein
VAALGVATGSVAHYLGLLAATCGDCDEAFVLVRGSGCDARSGRCSDLAGPHPFGVRPDVAQTPWPR